MISNRARTMEWIMGVREASPKSDPILIEKMVLALILVEQLRRSGLEFIFKGGTSLVLLLGMPRRFSIDIDIVLPDNQSLEICLQHVIRQGVFHRFEESKRAGELPKQHYRFYFTSAVQNKESHILLDILFERNPYPHLQEVELISPLISVEGVPTKIICPTLEGLLGDKLTAFAPHTTGIRFGVNKDLEMAKQLFDIAILFDAVSDIGMVAAAFRSIATQELTYRVLSEVKVEDVLLDTFTTAILVGMRGPSSNPEVVELIEGIKKLTAFIYSGFFTLDAAILCASKAAYLSILLMKRVRAVSRFDPGLDLSTWRIANPDYSRLNKLKKTSPEVFYYFFQALAFMNLTGE